MLDENYEIKNSKNSKRLNVVQDKDNSNYPENQNGSQKKKNFFSRIFNNIIKKFSGYKKKQSKPEIMETDIYEIEQNPQKQLQEFQNKTQQLNKSQAKMKQKVEELTKYDKKVAVSNTKENDIEEIQIKNKMSFKKNILPRLPKNSQTNKIPNKKLPMQTLEMHEIENYQKSFDEVKVPEVEQIQQTTKDVVIQEINPKKVIKDQTMGAISDGKDELLPHKDSYVESVVGFSIDNKFTYQPTQEMINKYTDTLNMNQEYQDEFITKMDAIKKKSDEEKLKEIKDTNFLDEFSKYINDGYWIAQNKHKSLNAPYYPGNIEVRKSPAESFEILEFCYKNLDEFSEDQIKKLGELTDDTLRLTKEYSLHRIDQDKFKSFIYSIPDTAPFQAVFNSSLVDLETDVKISALDSDFKQYFQDIINSKKHDKKVEYMNELESDEKYVSALEDSKFNEIIQDTSYNDNLDHDWMSEFTLKSSNVDDLLSNTENVQNFINHLKHKKEVFGQEEFQEAGRHEDLYKVLFPESCVVSAMLTHMDSINNSFDKTELKEVCMDYLQNKYFKDSVLLSTYAQTDDKEIQQIVVDKLNKNAQASLLDGVDLLDHILFERDIVKSLDKGGPLLEQVKNLIREVDKDEFAECFTSMERFKKGNLYKNDKEFKEFVDDTINRQKQLDGDEKDLEKVDNKKMEILDAPIEVEELSSIKHQDVLDNKGIKPMSILGTNKNTESVSHGVGGTQKQKNKGMSV